LQVSRWQFDAALRSGHKVFVVVTRQDSTWTTRQNHSEPYALTIVLDDRNKMDSRLYAQVQAELQAHVQVRARARV
jgi:hypothetical protein